MKNHKSQTRIYLFTIGIIIAIMLISIYSGITNIDSVESREASGQVADNGFEPEPLNTDLLQPKKDIHTPVKKEAVVDKVEPDNTPQAPETTTSVEKTPETAPQVEKAPDKTETVVTKDPVVKPAKKKEPKPEPVKPSFEPTAHSGDFMSEIELNMRSGPSIDFPSIGVLKPYIKAVASNKATISGGSSEWYEITVNGVTGWASANYLKTYKADAKPKPKPVAKPKPAAKPAAKPAPAKSERTDGFNFKGHHFSLANFSGSGFVPQETNNVYRWTDLPTHYLVEKVSPAGRVIRQVGVGDTVVVDGQSYTVTHIESGIPNDSEAGRKLFKHDAAITIQTCDNTKGPNGKSDVTYWWASKK